MKSDSKNLPPVFLSAIPLCVLVFLISSIVYVFGSDALAGASQIALLVAAAIAVGFGVFFGYTSWQKFECEVVKKISEVSQAIIILLLIGALSGAWMVSGIVPMFIYCGLQIISPECFLFVACVICAIVSLITGSSWTTIATIGIALIGIGKALGFSDGWIAGAIISGAYFGDKISPLSDTTVLASSSSGTPLFTHIRYMLYTTIPSLIIALLIYTIYGLTITASQEIHAQVISTGIKNTFNLTPFLFIVPAITGLLIAKKAPPIVVLFLSTLFAMILAIILQPQILHKISPDETDGICSIFKGVMISVYGTTNTDTGIELLNKLVSTKGMAGMMSTVWLILCAMVFGASMSATGMLESIMMLFVRFTKSAVSLVASTACVGTFMNTICGDQYLSIIMITNMFRKTYEDAGFESRLLSRTTEDSVTVTSALVPWNTCGMTQSTVLGVSVFTYAPFAFFNLVSPLMTILVAAIGYKIFRNGVPLRK